MLFKKALAQAIVEKRKTQTRRPIKDGEYLTPAGVHLKSGRMKIRLHGDYSVQFGYGLPGRWYNPVKAEMISMQDYAEVTEWYSEPHAYLSERGLKPLRIRIVNIRQEDVRSISHADALAEGFDNALGFWRVWCDFYDKLALEQLQDVGVGDAQQILVERPENRYQAWVYTFELE